MKRSVGIIDAKPSKRLYQSIIADYDLNRSICELIDNALDAWALTGKKKDLRVQINFDLDQQSIQIRDTAGGVKEDDLHFVIAPGHTGTKPEDNSIGFFGVGTKRAVVALAEDISIRSRWKTGKTFLVKFDDEWIREDDNWQVEKFEVDSIDSGTTHIDLSRLRRRIETSDVVQLKEHVGATYALFLNDPDLTIEIDGKPIKSRLFDNWAFPNNFSPREINGAIDAPDGRRVQATIVGGLTRESSPASGEYGIYLYCNGRLIARAVKTPDVGFLAGVAGLAHPKVSITRVIVNLKGDARDMPWNSSKSGINYGSPVFSAVREKMFVLLKYYAKLARGWVGQWDTKVFKYTKGSFIRENVNDFRSAKQLKLAPLPKLRMRFTDVTKTKNKSLIKKKPWAEGLQDGILAAELVSKASLSQKNRIALIILDSTLEIAMKDYLVHVMKIGMDKFRRIIDNRIEVMKEVQTSTRIKKTDWNLVDYYYKLRCGLIHEKSSVEIPDKDVANFRQLVEKILNKLHGLRF